MADYWMYRDNPFNVNPNLSPGGLPGLLQPIDTYQMPQQQATPVTAKPRQQYDYLKDVQTYHPMITGGYNVPAPAPNTAPVSAPVTPPQTQSLDTVLQPARANAGLGEVIDLDNLAKSTVFIDPKTGRYTSDNAAARYFINRESSGRADAENKGHYGLYQIGSGYWGNYGDKSIDYVKGALDPVTAHQAFIRGTTDAVKALQKWGVDPTIGNAWIIHNQGIGGAKNLFLNPDAVLTGKAYTNAIHNLGKKQAAYYTAHPELLTGRAFINYWNGK